MSEVAGLVGNGRVGGETFVDSTSAMQRDDVVARVALAGRDAFLEAARVAREAQRDWAEVPAPERGRLLMKVARVAEDNAERLAQLITREIGKPIRQSRFEANEFASMFTYYGVAALRPDGVLISSNHTRTQLFAFRAPLGVCALITPLNYPVAVPVWALAPALVTGNTVIWKPDVESAAVADLVLQILRDGGIPDGVVNLLYADPEQTYAGLDLALEERALDQVAFIGRTENGKEVGALCGRALLSPCIQLSGNNPLVLAPDGDVDAAVNAVRFSSFATNQGCTAIRAAIVPNQLHDEFARKLEASISAAPIGDPTDEDVLYGPMLSERYAQRFEEALATLAAHHATSGSTGIGRVTDENPRAGFVGNPSHGAYYHPTIVDGVRPGDLLFDREALGPLVGIASYDTLEEAIDLANAAAYGFLASVYTANPATAYLFRERVRAAVVAVNRPTSQAGEQRTPMGGMGDGGNNTRLAGPWALDNFTRWQTMSWAYEEHSASW